MVRQESLISGKILDSIGSELGPLSAEQAVNIITLLKSRASTIAAVMEAVGFPSFLNQGQESSFWGYRKGNICLDEGRMGTLFFLSDQENTIGFFFKEDEFSVWGTKDGRGLEVGYQETAPGSGQYRPTDITIHPLEGDQGLPQGMQVFLLSVNWDKTTDGQGGLRATLGYFDGEPHEQLSSELGQIFSLKPSEDKGPESIVLIGNLTGGKVKILLPAAAGRGL